MCGAEATLKFKTKQPQAACEDEATILCVISADAEKRLS